MRYHSRRFPDTTLQSNMVFKLAKQVPYVQVVCPHLSSSGFLGYCAPTQTHTGKHSVGVIRIMCDDVRRWPNMLGQKRKTGKRGKSTLLSKGFPFPPPRLTSCHMTHSHSLTHSLALKGDWLAALRDRCIVIRRPCETSCIVPNSRTLLASRHRPRRAAAHCGRQLTSPH